MKNGRSIVDLAKELQRQMESKVDLVAPTTSLSMTDNAELHVHGTHPLPFPIRETAHRQIGARVDIPAAYYDRMLADAPILLANNVNHWFQANPENRMIRTLDGRVRAFLSDRYQRIDNYEVAEAVLPILSDLRIEIASCEVTERRLYIKALNARVQGEVEVGDVVQAGVMITNSEIGGGALVVQPLVYRLRCKNGMVLPDSKFRRNHIGKALEVDSDAARFLTDETIALTDRAILAQARDVVRGALDEALFGRVLERMRAATQNRVEGDIQKAVTVLGKTVGLSTGETSGVLKALIDHGSECGGATRYGLLNAVTRFAQTVESYDRSTELEAIGGKILDLPKAQWTEIAKAA